MPLDDPENRLDDESACTSRSSKPRDPCALGHRRRVRYLLRSEGVCVGSFPGLGTPTRPGLTSGVDVPQNVLFLVTGPYDHSGGVGIDSRVRFSRHVKGPCFESLPLRPTVKRTSRGE